MLLNPLQEARALDLKRALMNQHDRTTAMQVQPLSWALLDMHQTSRIGTMHVRSSGVPLAAAHLVISSCRLVNNLLVMCTGSCPWTG